MIKGNVELDHFVVRWPVITQNLLVSAEIRCSRLRVVTVCSSIWADAGSSLTQTNRAVLCLHQLPSRCCHQGCTFFSQRVYILEGNARVYQESSHGPLLSVIIRAQSTSLILGVALTHPMGEGMTCLGHKPLQVLQWDFTPGLSPMGA